MARKMISGNLIYASVEPHDIIFLEAGKFRISRSRRTSWRFDTRISPKLALCGCNPFMAAFILLMSAVRWRDELSRTVTHLPESNAVH